MSLKVVHDFSSFMIYYLFKRLTDTHSKLWAYQIRVLFDGYIIL